MSTSLTQEEFLIRFRECSNPLILALNSDIEQYRIKLKETIRVQLGYSDFEEVDIDFGNLENELIKKALARIISLVYSNEAKG
jgi:hypothetical protein